MKIASIDIATAFCLTPNPYEVYLELPDALEKRFGKYVRMLKCVYGTRQAAHQFYMMMRGGLERAGYEACDDDVSNYAFVYPRTSDFELGAKFESGVETEILVRVGLELLLDQNSFCETPLRCGR